MLAPTKGKKTPAWKNRQSAGLLSLFLNQVSSPKASSKRGHFISVASSSGQAEGMGSVCQGMDQEPQEHPAVLQGDICVCRLGSFQVTVLRGGSASPPAPTAESCSPDKVLQTEVLPVDKEMKSPRRLPSTASSPLAPDHLKGLSSRTTPPEPRDARSPMLKPHWWVLPIASSRQLFSWSLEEILKIMFAKAPIHLSEIPRH